MMVMGMSIPPPEEAQSFVSKTLLDTVLVSQKPSHSPASGSRGHCLHLPVRAGQGAGGSMQRETGGSGAVARGLAAAHEQSREASRTASRWHYR